MAEQRKLVGYSGTPLAKKLGIGEGSRVLAIRAPGDYGRLLEPLPPKVEFVTRLSPSTDLVHLFTTRRAELAKRLPILRASIKADAAIWISWPKKSAGVPTDVTEDVIREVALPLDLVDIKVCAIDETWSGLKLGIRKASRSGGR
jgi:hypothetical protein